MAEQLIDLVTKELLAKFGAGAHKPGSGSAAAFNGMVSAMLLSTVIDLTKEPERSGKYRRELPELLRIQTEIKTIIYPNLSKLFQEDSDLFDKVISLRKERDSINRFKEPVKHRLKAEEANEALKLATDLPLEIARNAYKIGSFASKVFEKGFQAARGDSGVALDAAVAVIGGCIFIIDLNLSKLPADEWMEDMRKKKTILKTYHAALQVKANEKRAVIEKEAEEQYQFQQFFAAYRTGTLGETIRTDEDMEKLVRDFQNKLYLQRDKIWKKGSVVSAMDVLKPQDIVPKVLNYSFLQSDSLGVHAIGDDLFEVAGMLDRDQKLVSVSRQFPVEVMRFTAAHELAHLILHKDTILHRDRPLDGGHMIRKSRIETQADKFAAYFLMPSAYVYQAFDDNFQIEQVGINESSVLALRAGSIAELRAKCDTKYAFAKEIASASFFAGKSFKPLAELFEVSVGAMAKRLMELDLILY